MGSTGERKLDRTPTWSVAAVSAAIIIISLLLEKIIHKLGLWFTQRHKRSLFEALAKIKDELMVLGFISLILTFGQQYMVGICIPTDFANTMLPCGVKEEPSKTSEEEHRGRLLSSVSNAKICKEGHEPLISVEGLHELHILIFFLAVSHVVYSFVTMTLGRQKIRRWKCWEQETSSHEYEFRNDPSRFRLTREEPFVRAHSSFWTRIPFFFYIGCFFRQFFKSVRRVDYLTLRNGFINFHLAPGSKFNFQKYIKRSLEDDFKIVVGVSPVHWGSFVLFLLLTVQGWEVVIWSSLIPVIIILAVGTNLQAILTKMAIGITETHVVVQGIPLVQASDQYFWFGRPQLLLHLIHFALFQNAFQITHLFWIWYSFGLYSCYYSGFGLLILKLCLGVFVLLLYSYITLPLYALVSQMGSRMKRSIFDEQTSKALQNWQLAAKNKRKIARKSPTRAAAGGSTSQSSSYHSTRSSYTHEDHDWSDLEAEPLTPTQATTTEVSEIQPVN